MYNSFKKGNFEQITKDTVDDYRTKIEDDETTEVIYYGVDSIGTLGLLTEEKFEDTLIYTDVVGQKYDLNGIDKCVIVRMITVEDKFFAERIFAKMEGIDFLEKAVVLVMDEYGAEQGGGTGHIVTPGMYVEEVDDWCFSSRRKAGDAAIIENDYGYSICYISFIYECD